MSDTPETDNAIVSARGQWCYELRDTCRKLERERDEARSLAERLLKLYQQATGIEVQGLPWEG